MTFQLGEQAEWLIGARNDPFTCVCHAGEVVAVVPSGVMPYECDIKPPYTMLRLSCDTARPRNHESYIIHEPGKGRGAGKLYWPRVSGLRKVGESEESPK